MDCESECGSTFFQLEYVTLNYKGKNCKIFTVLLLRKVFCRQPVQSAKNSNDFGVHKSRSSRFPPLVVLEYGFGDNVDVSIISGNISFFIIFNALKKAFKFKSFWESK